MGDQPIYGLESTSEASSCINSTSVLDVSLATAAGSISDKECSLESCGWSEDSINADVESLPSANCSHEVSTLDAHEFSNSSISPGMIATTRDRGNNGCKVLTSTPTKGYGNEDTSVTPPSVSSIPPAKFFSRISKLKDDKSLAEQPETAIRQWNFIHVMQMEGCAKEYVTKVHELSEYDVLCAHSQFEART